jgi:hypothetical protein
MLRQNLLDKGDHSIIWLKCRDENNHLPHTIFDMHVNVQAHFDVNMNFNFRSWVNESTGSLSSTDVDDVGGSSFPAASEGIIDHLAVEPHRG